MKIFKVTYYDFIDGKIGPGSFIKAVSIAKAFEIAEYRAYKRVGYRVNSIEYVENV